ncbi:hypothetical protein OESDEN_04717 [Oesophagostomum dentatum]|uniref:Uncharacterized protein n=1 Tax=Oesophagostomum dentatum TaxID=61180 RepID=A0A0B1TDH9_OESDE|nr:hypothetical protein OESDEN_04717 [Oesophagostomum dentatum]
MAYGGVAALEPAVNPSTCPPSVLHRHVHHRTGIVPSAMRPLRNQPDAEIPRFPVMTVVVTRCTRPVQRSLGPFSAGSNIRSTWTGAKDLTSPRNELTDVLTV